MTKKTIPWSDLLDQEKKEIERRCRNGDRPADIAREHGISTAAIYRQISRWKKNTPSGIRGSQANGTLLGAPGKASHEGAVAASNLSDREIASAASKRAAGTIYVADGYGEIERREINLTRWSDIPPAVWVILATTLGIILSAIGGLL